VGEVGGERQGRCAMFRDLIEERFDPLPPAAEHELQKMSLPDLIYFSTKILCAQSLGDVGLKD
jgi:hypothetical protein